MNKPIAFVLLIIALCIVFSSCSSGVSPQPIVTDTDGSANAGETATVEDSLISKNEEAARTGIMDVYEAYVQKQTEKGEPVRGAGSDPIFFGYHLLAYHKVSGEDRYVLKPFTVTPNGEIYLSETQIEGLELKSEDMESLVSEEYLSRGLDLIVPDVMGGEETAQDDLKSFLNSSLGENDYEVGILGYVFLFGELGEDDCLLLSASPLDFQLSYVKYQK